MITITRKDKTCQIAIVDGPLGYTFYFEHNCSDEFYADLLRAHFDKNLRNVIQAIRKEEYEKGYKDGRAKRGKLLWFYQTLRAAVYTLTLFVCFSCSEEEVKPDCTPLKSTMELAAIQLFNVERSSPYNYGNEPTKAEVDAYNKQYEVVFDAYTQAVTDFHNCKHSN